MGPYSYGVLITNVAFAHLSSLPVVSASFTVFQVFSLYVVDLFLGPFGRSVSRLCSRRLSVHRVECCEINTSTLNTVSWTQFSVEVSSNDLHALLARTRVLLNCSVHF